MGKKKERILDVIEYGKGEKEKYIEQITALLNEVNDEQLLYFVRGFLAKSLGIIYQEV